MKKLVVVTQQVDPADSVLGATVPKLRALAERLGAGGHARSSEWTYTADEYADRVDTMEFLAQLT